MLETSLQSESNGDVLAKMAEAYVALLSKLPWAHKLVLEGLREGLNKFLSNAYLRSFPACRKHHLTQLISVAALERIQAGNVSGLVFEHVVPKGDNIQRPCEERAREGKLSPDFVLALLRRYWVLATITQDEDVRLAKAMPNDWDRRNVPVRYAAAGIELKENPLIAIGVPQYRLDGGLSEDGA